MEIRKKNFLYIGFYDLIMSCVILFMCGYLMSLSVEEHTKFSNLLLCMAISFVLFLIIYKILNTIFKNHILFEKHIKLNNKVKHINENQVIDVIKHDNILEFYIFSDNMKKKMSVYIGDEYDEIFSEKGIDFSYYDDKIEKYLNKKKLKNIKKAKTA